MTSIAPADFLRTSLFSRELILKYLDGARAAVASGDMPAMIANRAVEEQDPVWFLSVLAAILAEKCANESPTWAADSLPSEIACIAELLTVD